MQIVGFHPSKNKKQWRFEFLNERSQLVFKMVTTWSDILFATIVFFNALLHTIGCYLLYKTYTWTTISTQQLFIFNISLCECFACCYWMVFQLLRFNGFERSSKFIRYSYCVHIGLVEVLYMLMMALTFDRLMNILVGFKYPLYWNDGRTKKLLITLWIIGVACSIASAFVYHFKGFLWFWKPEGVYFTLVQSIAFIAVSFVIYSAIFWKYKQSRDALRRSFHISASSSSNNNNNNSTTTNNNNNSSTNVNEHNSAVKLFRSSRFYVSILIILTFLLFNTIPYCFLTLIIKNGKFVSGGGHSTAAVLMLHLSFTSDAVIYIFMQTDVRRTLFRTVCVCGCRHDERGNFHRNGFRNGFHGQAIKPGLSAIYRTGGVVIPWLG